MTLTPSVEPIPRVCTLADLVRILKLSRATIHRRGVSGTVIRPWLPGTDGVACGFSKETWKEKYNEQNDKTSMDDCLT